jgi:hypothetical protein
MSPSFARSDGSKRRLGLPLAALSVLEDDDVACSAFLCCSVSVVVLLLLLLLDARSLFATTPAKNEHANQEKSMPPAAAPA